MKDYYDADAGALRKRTEDLPGMPRAQTDHGEGQGQPFGPNGHARTGRLDFWVALDLLLQRWHWLVVGGLICGGAFYLLGYSFIKPKYVATAQLLRYEAPGKSEAFKTPPVSGETFAALIRSPDLLRRVGEKVAPSIAPETLTKCIKVDPDPDSDMVKVQLAARDPERAVELLNLYVTNAVEFTRDLEAKQAGLLANEYLKKQVEEMDKDITELQNAFRKLPGNPLLTNKLAQVGQLTQKSTNQAAGPRPTMLGFARQAERVQMAVGELNDLLLKYTEIHPLVQAKREQIATLQDQMAQASTNANLSPDPFAGVLATTPGELSPELEIVHIKLRALEDGRLELLKRQREAELYSADPPGTVRVFASADPKTVKANFRELKIGLVTIFGGLAGMAGSILLAFLVEFADNRMKTADDLRRVTRLPVLGSVGDLGEMTPESRAQWAFRAWTMLQGRLSPSANCGVVCAVTSAMPGEGRSTWIRLLAEAASLSGFRVLTIATQPSPTHVGSTDSMPEELSMGDSGAEETNGHSHALTPSILATPAQVTEQLTGPNSQPVVHIPLPGWVWNLERRKQWRDALNHWRRIENLVILVELPPASVPEAVLLGSNLPNLVWLADSGKATAAETRTQLETLRNARCNLVGAVLNRQPGRSVRECFPRWVTCLAFTAALGLAAAGAQDTNAPPASLAQPTAPATTTAPGTATAPAATIPATERPGAKLAVPEVGPAAEQPAPSFSVVEPAQRAAWQHHLTLGPGDVLNFALYGQPEVGRTEIAIGPDGRVSFLEAQDVLATGLTVDELRTKLDQELAKYRRAPRTMLTPVLFKSKKYYMLGKVATKGVYTLDRPLTVLEALARAHGLESGLVDRYIVSLTDFQHSFIARSGQRIPLSFDKLFQQGDLSQNVQVEPGDYIYFAPGDLKEVYVVGEVRLPGTVTYRPDLSVVAAITARGGYTDRAFKTRVLVVRGSLNNPERFVVNTHAVLDGKGLDFKLEPKDIIYVNSRPFILVEEAADLAATAFIQSIITSWVGVDVVKPFSQ